MAVRSVLVIITITPPTTTKITAIKSQVDLAVTESDIVLLLLDSNTGYCCYY